MRLAAAVEMGGVAADGDRAWAFFFNDSNVSPAPARILQTWPTSLAVPISVNVGGLAPAPSGTFHFAITASKSPSATTPKVTGLVSCVAPSSFARDPASLVSSFTSPAGTPTHVNTAANLSICLLSSSVGSIDSDSNATWQGADFPSLFPDAQAAAGYHNDQGHQRHTEGYCSKRPWLLFNTQFAFGYQCLMHSPAPLVSPPHWFHRVGDFTN